MMSKELHSFLLLLNIKIDNVGLILNNLPKFPFLAGALILFSLLDLFLPLLFWFPSCIKNISLYFNVNSTYDYNAKNKLTVD